MPVLDGASLLSRLKTEQPSVMRVIHSSHIESLTTERAQDLADAVLAKPGRPGELVAVLEWAITQRRRGVRDSIGY
jgi:CheY-like chemotaxis protein